MDGVPIAFRMAHDVLCSQSIDEAEIAFSALALEDLEAARHLAAFLNRIVPNGAPLWAAIIAHAPRHSTGKPWRWHERDPADTANAVERFMRGR